MSAPAPLRNLDFLRALALATVCAAHFSLAVFGADHLAFASMKCLGRAGVLLFFVHTSLVLMMSIERDPRTWAFYIRRAFRVYPLSLVCIAVALLFQIPAAPDWGFKPPTLPAIVANLLLVQNITGSDSIVSPMWSLPWEIQMYLVLPFLAALVRRYNSATLLVLLALFSIGLRTLLMATLGGDPLRLLHFVPCFLGGVLAYQLRRTSEPWLPAWLWPPCLVSLLLVFLAIDSNNIFIDSLFCLAVSALIPYCSEETRNGPLQRSSATLATYSYSIYLFHEQVIWLAFFVLPPGPIRWAAFAALAVAIPTAAYRLIESPMINLGKRLTAPSRIVEKPQPVLSPAFSGSRLRSPGA